MDPKAWYLSRAVWGGVVAILASLFSAFGINLDEAAQADAVNIGLALAGAVGGALAIYGRVRASAPIGKLPSSAEPPGPSAPRIVTAVDAVKAAQDAVRTGDSPTIPAAIATARNAVDALLHTLSEGKAR